jgi:hypothetical protein
VIEVGQSGGDAQHGAASRLPLQAAGFGIRQDLGQQRARPLQAAGVGAAECSLDTQGLFFQEGEKVCRRGGLIEERLRQPFLRCRE